MALDPRMPPRDECVLRDLLDRHARERPDAVFAVFRDGRRWTYRELHAKVRAATAGLQRAGVAQGERVLCWLPNGAEAILAWFAINYAGAVFAPLNTSYRGELLAHAVRTGGGTLMLAHRRLADRLAGLDTGALRRLALTGEGTSEVQGFDCTDLAAILEAPGEPAPLARPIEPWDLQSIIFTSGTTGPSKAVLSSYLHLHAAGAAFHFLREDDRGLTTLPLFHQAGTGAIYRMLIRGASIAVVESFRTHEFWDDVRATEATFLTLLGAMTRFLLGEPPSERDREHTLRHALMVPLTEDARSIHERFGIDLYTAFNMTEVSCPLFSGRNPGTPGSCGRPRPGIEARVADENDCEMPTGATGELLLRADMPWAFGHGYEGAPEATARAWRNGWFHTGDAFRVDAQGEFHFVDRLKDAIRRRGENVSSFEVEREVLQYPGVREAAAVAARSEHGEDEVLVVLSCQPGADVEPRALVDFLLPRLPHFMVPRYLRVLAELPKTPTGKVQKHVLRDAGAAGAWDRELEMGALKRERLGS
ncbi:AMP-binding protein [Ramlibacter sp. PS3R-8]|uniref:AMP-binding protein n=1 Tax=Ramlibacter sp. PS3R-8 TaxID=3133437 RepID=UPI0030A9B33F